LAISNHFKRTLIPAAWLCSAALHAFAQNQDQRILVEHAPDPKRSAASDFVMPENFFPITSWEAAPQDQEMLADRDHGIPSLAQAGFTTVAFVHPKLLPECERLGMKAIVAEDRASKKWKGMSDDDITSYVKKMVDDSRGSSAVLGYLLMDEPGASQFPALAKAVAAVRKFAPGKLAYINLFPDYATISAKDISQLETANYEEYLERYVTEVKPQFISYDNYRVLQSNDLKVTTAALSYYKNLLAIRNSAQKHNLPFWNIVSSNRIRPLTPVPSPANMLFQAYTTLAAGGQGVTWFTYYVHGYAYAAIDKEGRRGPTWSYLRMVNEQLKVIGPRMRNLRSTGVYFSSPPPVDGLPLLPGQLVRNAQADAPIMVGEFTSASGEKYAMLVNLSLEHSSKVHLALTATPAPTSLEYVSPVDGSILPLEKLPLEKDNFLWLTAGQGALIKL
jgi:hypothetical protein